MLIRQKRIRNITKYLWLLKQSKKFYISLNIDNETKKRLKEMWITEIKEWLQFLPSIVWSITSYNAEWRVEIDKSKPMETHYSEIEWTRHEWIWRWKTRGITDIRYRPYKKYPRKEILPPGMELTISSNNRLVSPLFEFDSNKSEDIILAINIFLEMFWEAEIISESLVPLLNTSKCVRMNWIFIRSWRKEFREQINRVVAKKSTQQKHVINYRLDIIEKYWLVPKGVWSCGFSWYIALQSANKKLTIFENLNYGNAIYICDWDWAEFSKKSKTEILNEKLHVDKIPHNKWRQTALKKYC